MDIILDFLSVMIVMQRGTVRVFQANSGSPLLIPVEPEELMSVDGNDPQCKPLIEEVERSRNYGSAQA